MKTKREILELVTTTVRALEPGAQVFPQCLWKAVRAASHDDNFADNLYNRYIAQRLGDEPPTREAALALLHNAACTLQED